MKKFAVAALMLLFLCSPARGEENFATIWDGLPVESKKAHILGLLSGVCLGGTGVDDRLSAVLNKEGVQALLNSDDLAMIESARQFYLERCEALNNPDQLTSIALLITWVYQAKPEYAAVSPEKIVLNEEFWKLRKR